MCDLEVLNLIKSYLALEARSGQATPEEVLCWCDFYLVHDRIIRAIVKRVIAPMSEVDDVAQDTWAVLARRLPSLTLDPTRGTLEAWVAAVARHQACNFARRRSRRHDEALTPELATDLLDPALGPTEEMERKQRHCQVDAAVAKLCECMPARHRRIIVQYWIEEQPLSAIASGLGVSEDSIWSIIRGTRPKLLDVLLRAGMDADLKKN
jgi:RNA polymerase sigma factor (sigma-70 family)